MGHSSAALILFLKVTTCGLLKYLCGSKCTKDLQYFRAPEWSSTLKKN